MKRWLARAYTVVILACLCAVYPFLRTVLPAGQAAAGAIAIAALWLGRWTMLTLPAEDPVRELKNMRLLYAARGLVVFLCALYFLVTGYGGIGALGVLIAASQAGAAAILSRACKWVGAGEHPR